MYSKPADLRILFPTSFSDACFRTSRAIAQLADKCCISLTIAHVCKPGKATARQRRELDSFMAEADHYEQCRRVLLESDDRVEAIGELCDNEHFDLVLAPASDRLGLHKVLTSSFRSRLLKRCSSPLWTAGKTLDLFTFKHTIQSVACVVDFDCPGDTHIRLASAFAQRMGAALHMVTIVEPIHEGTLVRAMDSRAPLLPEAALEKLRVSFSGTAPEVHVAVGESSSQLGSILKRCDADVAFVGENHVLRGVLAGRMAGYIDRLPCPVICTDGASASFGKWSFESNRRQAPARRALPTRNEALAS